MKQMHGHEKHEDPNADRDNAAQRSGNMHDDVQPHDDTCSCEPEPRWQELDDQQQQSEDT
jgi:hypothetical protein